MRMPAAKSSLRVELKVVCVVLVLSLTCFDSGKSAAQASKSAETKAIRLGLVSKSTRPQLKSIFATSSAMSRAGLHRVRKGMTK